MSLFGSLFKKKSQDSEPAREEIVRRREHALSVARMQISDARAEFEQAIARNDVSVVVNDTRSPLPQSLSPELARLFGEYLEVSYRTPAGSFIRISKDLLSKPLARFPGLLVIGEDIDHTVTLAKPLVEGVYIVDSSDSPEELDDPDYRSVYHWFLSAIGPVDNNAQLAD